MKVRPYKNISEFVEVVGAGETDWIDHKDLVDDSDEYDDVYDCEETLDEILENTTPDWMNESEDITTQAGHEGVSHLPGKPSGRHAGSGGDVVSDDKDPDRKVVVSKFLYERNNSKRKEFLSEIGEEDLAGHKIVLMNEGKSGCAISPGGELKNLFNNDGPNGGAKVIWEAIKQGATKLDCFDNFLPDYYSKFGFKETDRMKWDDQYKPKNWDVKKLGRPDVVFMERSELKTHGTSEFEKSKYLEKLIAKKGAEYVKENKGLLDAQWEYIESLGDPEAVKPEN